MIVAESRRTRRVVGRFDRGAELVEGLREVCAKHRVHAGEVRAAGALEQAVLAEYDQRTRSYRAPRRFDAQLEILQLVSSVSEHEGKPFVQPRVTLSRERDNGIELVGGQLVSGRVFAVEFVIDAFDDLVLKRGMDQQTGLPLLREAVLLGDGEVEERHAPAPPSFEAPAKMAWEQVVAASEASHSAPAPAQHVPFTESEPARTLGAGDDDNALIGPGDLIDHPKFGRCQVERIDGDHEFVSARLRNQRLIRLSLDVLTLVLVGHEDGKRLFKARLGQ